MAPPTNPQAAALLAHVVSQMESHVNFLLEQNYISPSNATSIISVLPSTAPIAAPVERVPVVSHVKSIASPPIVAKRTIPPPPARPVGQGRAVWSYNEDGQEPDDLSFSAGDIIEIVSEVNDDWWMGRHNGKQALFPANYVERISKLDNADTPSLPQRRLPPAVQSTSEKPAYKPFGAAYHGADAPPSAGGVVNSVGLQQDPGQAEKKSKYGKYGNTMAHSAAGGVGFGAGAAIGGGLVRAIF